MHKSSERRRINLVEDTRPGNSPPPMLEPLRPSAVKTLLRRLLDWVRRPQVLVSLSLAVASASAWILWVHLRPPTIEGTALPRNEWKAISSSNPGGFLRKPERDHTNPDAALDGNLQTRWTPLAPQRNIQWFAVDMGQPRQFHQVVLDAGPFVRDYPRGYAVYVSADGMHWGSAVASGQGSKPLTIVNLGPQQVRYLKIVQTGQDLKLWWSISELNVYEN